MAHLPLRADHDRQGFSCGRASLDAFLRDDAEANMASGVSRVFVMTPQADVAVVGYYAASVGSVGQRIYPGALPTIPQTWPIPAVHLGRLAVRNEFKGRGFGKTLLFHFLRGAVEIAERAAVHLVDLFAGDDEARAFYLKYGFMPLKKNDMHLYLPMTTVRAMMA